MPKNIQELFDQELKNDPSARASFFCALTLYGARVIEPGDTIEDATQYYSKQLEGDCTRCSCVKYCPLCRIFE